MASIREWLDSIGFGQYAETFEENAIGWDVLPRLDHNLLKDIGVRAAGDRVRILRAIESLEAEKEPDEASRTPLPVACEPLLGSEAERRQLTVMFCDLVGSTELSQRLDPEELREVMRAFQDRCAGVLSRFGGFIARYMGDGLLVYFGYPQAFEDAAERSVRAGLEIVAAMEGLECEHGDASGVTLSVRVGVATGMVVVGDIVGEGAAAESAVVGETPNLAARLQALADANAVVVGPRTRQLLGERFEYADLGTHELKGLVKPVRAWRVIGVAETARGFERSRRLDLASLVGREEEINLLLRRWEQAKDGESRVVLLSGEAGIGKSRILREFQARLQDEPRNRILYYCSPYHQNSAFHPVIDQLERAFRFGREDDTSQRLDKIDATLRDLGLPVEELAPPIATLLALPTGERYAPFTPTPTQLKQQTLQALLTVAEAMAAQRPVLMVIEDVHWIDPSTQEYVSLLIEQLQSSRLLVLITGRPEFESPWRSQTHVTHLTLSRLARKESSAVVSGLTGGMNLPAELLSQIIDKTDGVPLFLEELTKTVLESGILDASMKRDAAPTAFEALSIPESLQDSLMARLDRLAPVKETVQLAASIGRSFSHEILEAVSPIKGNELQNALDQVIKAGLIHRRALLPSVIYDFKHVLIRDAAYQSMLKSTRRDHHRRIGFVLEDRFPKSVETEPELLAHHFTQAGLTQQAIDYRQRAGELAAKRSANLEAVSHFTMALEQLKNLPESSERDKQELALQIGLGPLLAATKGYASPEFAQTYERARVLCNQLGEPQRFPVVWGLWFARNQTGQLSEAFALADEILAIGQRQADTGVLLEGHHCAWTSRFAGGELRDVLAHAKEGKALYDIDQHRSHALLYGGHDPGVCCRYMGAMTLCLLGFPDQGRDWIRDAIALAEKLKHQPTLAFALSFASTVYQFRREAKSVQEHADRLSALCAEHGFAFMMAMAKILRGWSLAAQGQMEEGLEQSSSGLDALRATGLRRLSFQLAILAESYAWAGNHEGGLQAVNEALSVVKETGEERWAPEVYRLKGELLLAQPTPPLTEAETWLNRAIELARRQEAKLFELRATSGLARQWRDQGKIIEARDLLVPVYRWFTEGFDSSDLKEAKALLDELG